MNQRNERCASLNSSTTSAVVGSEVFIRNSLCPPMVAVAFWK